MDDLIFNPEQGIALPGSINGADDNQYEELLTSGVEEAIVKHEIKPVLVQSSADVECPAYLLEMTDVESITAESLNAIQGLLGGGDTAVYIKNNDVIMRIGYGEESVLYAILDGVIKQMYDGQCGIYKNKGRGFEPIKETEVDTVRLNL